MKKIKLAISVLILTIFSCKKDEVIPVVTRIEFELSTLVSSYELGDYIYPSITRIGNYDFETNANVNFYISKDNSYSSEDIQINPSDNSLYTTFSGNDSKRSFSINLNSLNIESGNYYLIAKLQPSSSPTSSVRYCNTPIRIVVPKYNLSLSGISFFSNSSYNSKDTVSVYYAGSTIYSSLKYASTFNTGGYFSYSYYLSTDNKYDKNTDNQIYTSYSSNPDITSNGNLHASFNLPSSIDIGTYYLIAIGSYTINSKTLATNTVSQKFEIKKFVDLISITGMSIPETSYSTYESFITVLTITNGNLTSQQLSLTNYLSINKTIDNNDDDVSYSSYNVIKPGNNVITLLSTISNGTSSGPYYLLARANYYSSFNSTSVILTFAGPSIQIVPPEVSISGLSLYNSTITAEIGDSFNYTITTVSDLNTSYTQYFAIETYFSLDTILSGNDLIGNTYNYIQYQKGSYKNSITGSIPSTATNGTYYLIIRYKKPEETTYSIITTGTIIVQDASVILFRNTQNTSYSALYLFIDDVYVKTLDCYSSMSSPTCAAFDGVNCYSSYSAFYYKFFGSDGSHTYKLRTTNNLSTGATLNTNTFNSNSSSCSTVDVD